ncbi:MAG: SpoIIE family protein phosphatase [Bryobacteraceae bacterium]|nr:SpoIIE family protein phosphatase [Bryobacteraceae bacterium]
MALHLALRWAAPGSPWAALSLLAATFLGLAAALRLARRGIRIAIWRLRNRLIVAYLFIAVVPIVLIVLLAATGAYLLYGQIAVYLVSTELERRVSALDVPVMGLLTTDPRHRAEGLRWMAPYFEQRLPGLQLLVRDKGRQWRYPEGGEIVPPPEGWREARGVVLRQGSFYLWRRAAYQDADALALMPLTRQFLAGLVPGLGEVAIVNPERLEAVSGGARSERVVTFRAGRAAGEPEPAGPPDRVQRQRAVTFRAGSRSRAPGVAAGSGHIPPAANWLDIEVAWFTWLPVALWESPGESRTTPVVVTSRPSAVLRTLFNPRVDWTQGFGFLIFLVVGSMFLVVELVSLLVGVNLTRTITGAVHNLYEGTQRVMRGDFSHRIQVSGGDQLAELSRSFNLMTENLERLLRVEKEKERLQSELEIARQVQSQLYPKQVPEVPGLELAGLCQPARIVSGDYYDYLGLGDGRVALAIGDVAGKGISAALLMATVQSALRTQLRACWEGAATGAACGQRGSDAVPAGRIVAQLNQQLYAFTSPEKFATFFFAVYDSVTGLLTYTNAGHPAPVVLRDGAVLRLEANGMVVGAFPFAEYGESRIGLEPGDVLVCFTDGVTEPENEYAEMFGEQRLIEVLRWNANRRPTELIRAVIAAVTQWTRSPELPDDMTLLVARRS